MENKYYTPTTDEFFEGFDYEYSEDGKEWVATKFSIGIGDTDSVAGDWYEFSPNNPNTKCRVKYLDRDDIEELGWKFKYKCQWEIPFTYSFSDVGIGVVENVKGAWKLIYTKDRYCSIVHDCYGETPHFRGEIKNKSELKKLMVQLGIK